MTYTIPQAHIEALLEKAKEGYSVATMGAYGNRLPVLLNKYGYAQWEAGVLRDEPFAYLGFGPLEPPTDEELEQLGFTQADYAYLRVKVVNRTPDEDDEVLIEAATWGRLYVASEKLVNKLPEVTFEVPPADWYSPEVVYEAAELLGFDAWRLCRTAGALSALHRQEA